ncbi:MAG: hypothetical protein ACI4OP_08300 [Candidatus Coprovivens sp.]
MKRNTINIQINNDNILFYINDEYKREQIPSLSNYKITNKIDFIEQLRTIIDKYKINNKLLTDNINIIIDNTYTKDDKDKIIDIFKELSFNNINLITNTDILQKNNNDLIINVSNNNIKFYHKYKNIDENIYFDKYLEILTLYIKEYISKYKIKCIKLYGDYKDMQKLINKLERKVRKEVYIYTQRDIIPLCYFIE